MFGVRASPFLLNIIVHVAMSIKKLRDAILTHDALVERFALAGFNLRDWKTNSIELRKALGLNSPPGEIAPVFGISWNTDEDWLFLKSQPKEPPQSPTKRTVLSFLASIFDPAGLFSPCLLPLKLFMQECSKSNFGWNDKLPSDFITRFTKLFYEAIQIPDIKIPRRIWKVSGIGSVTLNIFCDASQFAYACVVYLTYTNSETQEFASSMIYSKIRVAPIKMHPIISNLELLAVLIGKRSAIFLLKKIKVKISRIVLWTDATTVLQWLKSTNILQKFVQIRVNEIRQTPNLICTHVSEKINPADIASRGMSPANLAESELWREGPPWLPHEKLWPSPPENTETFSTPTVALAANTPKYDRFENQRSSWDTYVKIIKAFMILFGK